MRGRSTRHARMTARRRRSLVAVAAIAAVVAFGAGLAISGRPQSSPGRSGDALHVALPSVVAAADRNDQSRDGAIAAAVEYATLMSRLLPVDPSDARRMVAEIASDDHRAALVAAVDAELVPLQRQLAGLPGATVHRESVLATKVGAYADQPEGTGRAQVSVWVMLTLGQNTEPSSTEEAGQRSNPVASFGTVVLDLVWERRAWRLDGTTQRPGPTPLLDGEPQATDEFAAELAGFADWRPA
jgi:hypothetical protein